MEWNERNIAILGFLIFFVVFFMLALGIGAILFTTSLKTIPLDLVAVWLIISFIIVFGASLFFAILMFIIRSAFKKKKAPDANKPKEG